MLFSKRNKIRLCSTSKEMCNSWQRDFADCDDIEIYNGDILKKKADIVVSPANSFGYMDGGLDLHLSEKLGWHIHENLISIIKQLPMRELLIGQSLMMETGNKKFPKLLSVPTMRVPTDYLIKESVNAYLAMKATMIAFNDSSLKTINIPAFCKGIGEMSEDIVSIQMRWAFNEIYLNKKIEHNSFLDMKEYHFLLNERRKNIKY